MNRSDACKGREPGQYKGFDPDWQTLIGALAFGLLLALSLPGVEVARADPAVSPAAQVTASAKPENPLQCTDAAKPVRARARVEAAVWRQLSKQQGAKGQPKIVVLNTRGYNYGSQPSVDVRAIQREAARARR